MTTALNLALKNAGLKERFLELDMDYAAIIFGDPHKIYEVIKKTRLGIK
jgi:hypothetical protein